MAELSFKGSEPLMKALQTAANQTAHKAIVKKFGGQLQSTAKRKANFTQGYATGATKWSIKLELTEGGFAAKVIAGSDYSGYLEKGTRFMEAQPFMKPALEEIVPDFVNDLRRAGIVK